MAKPQEPEEPAQKPGHSPLRRKKGKRGGLRVIYYWWQRGRQFWLFTVFDKDEAVDLTTREKKALKQLLLRELEERQ